MLKIIIILLACVMFPLYACAPTVFTLGGQTYQSSAEALAAQRAQMDAILVKIEPVPTPYGGRVTVFIPSDADLRARGMINTGTPAPEVVDYIAAVSHRALSFFHEVVVKKNLFESAELRDVVGTVRPDIGPGEHAIWAQLLGPNQSGWKYYTADMTESVSFVVDNSLPLGGERYFDWLEKLTREVERHGGVLVSGGGVGGQAAPAGGNAPVPASSSGGTGKIKRTLNPDFPDDHLVYALRSFDKVLRSMT